MTVDRIAVSNSADSATLVAAKVRELAVGDDSLRAATTVHSRGSRGVLHEQITTLPLYRGTSAEAPSLSVWVNSTDVACPSNGPSVGDGQVATLAAITTLDGAQTWALELWVYPTQGTERVFGVGEACSPNGLRLSAYLVEGVAGKIVRVVWHPAPPMDPLFAHVVDFSAHVLEPKRWEFLRITNAGTGHIRLWSGRGATKVGEVLIPRLGMRHSPDGFACSAWGAGTYPRIVTAGISVRLIVDTIVFELGGVNSTHTLACRSPIVSSMITGQVSVGGPANGDPITATLGNDDEPLTLLTPGSWENSICYQLNPFTIGQSYRISTPSGGFLSGVLGGQLYLQHHGDQSPASTWVVGDDMELTSGAGLKVTGMTLKRLQGAKPEYMIRVHGQDVAQSMSGGIYCIGDCRAGGHFKIMRTLGQGPGGTLPYRKTGCFVDGHPGVSLGACDKDSWLATIDDGSVISFSSGRCLVEGFVFVSCTGAQHRIRVGDLITSTVSSSGGFIFSGYPGSTQVISADGLDRVLLDFTINFILGDRHRGGKRNVVMLSASERPAYIALGDCGGLVSQASTTGLFADCREHCTPDNNSTAVSRFGDCKISPIGMSWPQTVACTIDCVPHATTSIWTSGAVFTITIVGRDVVRVESNLKEGSCFKLHGDEVWMAPCESATLFTLGPSPRKGLDGHIGYELRLSQPSSPAVKCLGTGPESTIVVQYCGDESNLVLTSAAAHYPPKWLDAIEAGGVVAEGGKGARVGYARYGGRGELVVCIDGHPILSDPITRGGGAHAYQVVVNDSGDTSLVHNGVVVDIADTAPVLCKIPKGANPGGSWGLKKFSHYGIGNGWGAPPTPVNEIFDNAVWVVHDARGGYHGDSVAAAECVANCPNCEHHAWHPTTGECFVFGGQCGVPPPAHTSPWLLHNTNPVYSRIHVRVGRHAPTTDKKSIAIVNKGHIGGTGGIGDTVHRNRPPNVPSARVCITFNVSEAATIKNHPVSLVVPEDRLRDAIEFTLLPDDWGEGTHRHCLEVGTAVGGSRVQSGWGVDIVTVEGGQNLMTGGGDTSFFLLPNRTIDNTRQEWVYDQPDCLAPGCGLVCPTDKHATPPWATVFTGQHSPICRLVDAVPTGDQISVAGSPFTNGLSQDLCAPPYYSEWARISRSVQCGPCETRANPFPFSGVGVASRTGARNGIQSEVWSESRHHVTTMTPTGWAHCPVLRNGSKPCETPCPRDCLFAAHSTVARVPPICHEAGRSRKWWETIASVSFTRGVVWRANDIEGGGLSCATQHRRQMVTFKRLGFSGWCDEGMDFGDGSRVTLTFKPASADIASRIQNETGATLCNRDHQYLDVCPSMMAKTHAIMFVVSLVLAWVFGWVFVWVFDDRQISNDKGPSQITVLTTKKRIKPILV